VSLSRQLLVYSSQLRKGDYGRGWGGTPEIEAAVTQAWKDRLDLAEAFCASAEAFAKSATNDMDYRNAVSRAYYACHHAIRACVLGRQNGDEPDHMAAISEFADVVSAERFLETRLGTSGNGTQSDLMALMHRRHLADYYPYSSSYPLEAPLEWEPAAAEAVGLARRVVDAVKAYLATR